MANLVYFIDANIPMYAVGAAHPLKQPCVAILDAIVEDQLTAVTNSEVLQEILHRYTAIGQRERAVEVMRLIVQVIPEVLPVTKEDLIRAAALHEQYSSLAARDSVHLAVIQRNGITELISADRHFDVIAGLTRHDPAHWPT